MKLSLDFRKRNSSKKSTNLDESSKKSFSPKRFAKRIAKNATVAFIYALIFSLPIYINFFTYLSIDSQTRQITAYLPYINTIFALLAVASALQVDKKYRFFFGFFVGILWFYWVNLSFRFTPAPYLMWVGIIGVAVGYGIVFYLLLFFNNKFFRILSLAIIGLVPVLGFDWLVVESLFSFSILRVDKISFIFIMICVAISSNFLLQMRESKKPKKRNLKKAVFALIPLIFVIDFSHTEAEIPKGIFITEMNVNQNAKWAELDRNIEMNFRLIDEAIVRGDKVIILPETAFPLRLNQSGREYLMERLLDLSHHITIITGGQRGEYDFSNSDYIRATATYNTTFVFEKGQWNYADKIFLAPFGEYAPVPKIFAEMFKSIFGIDIVRGFDKSGGLQNDLETELFNFRAAICYEATTRKAFDGDPKIMVAISNSAWFAPSIEPVLQMMLMKYYARIHKTLIIQSANGSKSLIVTPNISLRFVARD